MTAKIKMKEQPALFEEGAVPAAEQIAKEAPSPKQLTVKKAASPPKGTAVAKAERKAPLSDEASDEIATLLRVVADPNCDVAKAERIEQMLDRARARRAQIFYDRAYTAMQEELPEITKDNKIVIEKNGRVVQSTPYASYSNIQRIIKPIVRKHGFTLEHWTEPGIEGVGIVMFSTLSYSHGLDFRHVKTAKLPLKIENSGSKNDIQGVSSSISYGKRINTNTLLDLTTFAPQDEDVDGNRRAKAGAKTEPEPDAAICAADLKKVEAAIKNCQVPLTTVLIKYNIDGLAEMKAVHVKAVLEACANYKAESQKRARSRSND